MAIMRDTLAQPESAPRHEERFIASEELARLVMRTAGSHLQLARDDRPYQWSTTVYCDTYDWKVYRAAEQGAALRLRFREYHRTRPEDAFTSARLWLESRSPAISCPRSSAAKRSFPRPRMGCRRAPARSFATVRARSS